MKQLMLSIAGTVLLAGFASGNAAEVDVMTQNQYVGTDLIGLVASPDFNAAVIEALQNRAASLPTERARALSALIDKRAPALVGLQEVYNFTCVDTNPMDLKGCENQSIAGAFTNQLDDTLAALGGRYHEAATVVNLDLPASLGLPVPGIPIAFDDTTIYVSVTDRDVILARDDVITAPIDFTLLPNFNGFDFCARPSADGCNYLAAASAPLSIAGMVFDVRFERGFVGVDALVDGLPYRFVNTHLETRLESFGPIPPFGRIFQSAQAAELIGTLQLLEAIAPSGPMLAVGDFNSDPRDGTLPVPPPLQPILGVTEIIPPYLQMVGSGYTDAWTLRPGASTGKGAPLVGFSCCQDEDLGNHKSKHYERIDLIFSLEPPARVKEARLLGESVSDKTPPKGLGLWPSDHSSVAARLQFPR